MRRDLEAAAVKILKGFGSERRGGKTNLYSKGSSLGTWWLVDMKFRRLWTVWTQSRSSVRGSRN